ncbi:MAG: beta-L-arabinofuranosidase domain-containing protein, partial [Thermoguttaceae bacterium]
RAVMDSQRDDGWFGPRESLTSLDGKPDLWPHMLMLNILQSYHEATGDPRAIEVMTRFLKWEATLPETAFGEGYWPRLRAGDNIESALWLYNRTGDAWLLDLARKINRGMARWDRDVIDWHNVNIAQGFRAGTVFGMVSKEARDRESAERNYETVMARYGQQPGGGFVGDENCRPGYFDPRGGFETCGIVEFMHSFEMLCRITGLPVWADRCEEIAINSFPAAMMPDQKGLHYLTGVNQVQLDRNNKSPGVQNGGTMFSYSPGAVYRCCQHNVSHGWPYYAEEMWLATADNGLCASLYAPSDVTTKVAQGDEVSIHEETGYPFRDSIEFKLSAPRNVQFPLYLRVPQWCCAASVKVNGEAIDVKARPLSYVVLDRTWKDGDRVTLQLPMQVAVRRWPKNHDAVSVSYGPLGFSLAIQERWEKYGDPKAKWPEWEVFPKSAWNYGLALDAQDPAKSFEVVRQPGEVPLEPFTADAAPLALKVKARKIPNWQTDRNQMVEPLQPSPVRSTEPLEEIRLIPSGAARLRIGMFPAIGDGPDAHDWVAPVKPRKSAYRASASHCFESDTLDALDNGLEPASSDDESIPRFTWWPHKGSQEWVQYTLPAPASVSGAEVYWFDDTGHGECRVPASWRLCWRDGDQWKAVQDGTTFSVAKDRFNSASFAPVTTDAVRLDVQLRKGFSGGILQWRLKPASGATTKN